MRLMHALRRWSFLASSGALLGVGGCWTALENSADMLLSPSAAANTLTAPYSPVAGMVQFFARYILGG